MQIEDVVFEEVDVYSSNSSFKNIGIVMLGQFIKIWNLRNDI